MDRINEIKELIEKIIFNIGFIEEKKLYETIGAITNKFPSYKVIADIVYSSVYNSANKEIYSDREIWDYTRLFVNTIKNNLVLNNKNFIESMVDGLINPINNIRNKDIKILKKNKKTKFRYLKDYFLDEENRMDYVLCVDNFNVVTIQVFDDEISIENVFEKLEDTFDKFPEFYKFNRLIILTDGNKIFMGTIFDYIDEYYEINLVSSNKNENKIEYLFNFISSEKIIDSLNKKNIFENVEEEIIKFNQEILTEDEDGYNENYNQAENIDMDLLSKLADYDFIEENFTSDLDSRLDSDEFKERSQRLVEVVDYKNNNEYLKDIKENKSKKSLELIVKANQRLVYKYANKLKIYCNSSIDFDDLIQCGNIGLIKAAKKFDFSKEASFSTYAHYWILQSITRYIQEYSLNIRIPVHMHEKINSIEKLEKESLRKFNIIDYEWIAKELLIDTDELLFALRVRNSFMHNTSLDVPVGIDEDTSILDFVEDGKTDVYSEVEYGVLRDILFEILGNFSKRTQYIIVKRFGLDGNDPQTLEEIGKQFNLSRERIRQIEKRFIIKVRTKKSLISKLVDFY